MGTAAAPFLNRAIRPDAGQGFEGFVQPGVRDKRRQEGDGTRNQRSRNNYCSFLGKNVRGLKFFINPTTPQSQHIVSPGEGPARRRGSVSMSRSIEDVKNWMNMFRWIVKLIRDEYGIDEKVLTRTATLETDVGLTIEQVEQVLEFISESFTMKFPEGTLDEIVKLEELCMLASWIKGFYKRPEFISDDFEQRCRQVNQIAA